MHIVEQMQKTPAIGIPAKNILWYKRASPRELPTFLKDFLDLSNVFFHFSLSNEPLPLELPKLLLDSSSLLDNDSLRSLY